MSAQVVKEIAARAIQDDAFRTQLQADPAKTLAGYDLTDAERQALSTAQFGSIEDLESMDDRLSKWCGINVIIAEV
jgi:hypothetical protein